MSQNTTPTLSCSADARHFSTTLVPDRRGERGIAIITVLSVLLLMTVLILAFFNMAQSELEDAKFYSEGVRSRQLSEVVTSVVTSQIRKATSMSEVSSSSNRYTWASQPGAITQFSSRWERAGGTDYYDLADTIYKLYSTADMVEENVSPGRRLADDVPGDWDTQPARFVDLNEPVYSAGVGRQGRLFFPIIDPRGFAGNEREDIEGFSYSDSNSRGRRIAGIVEPGNGGALQQRLPMPVEWLYMLADGTLGSVDQDGKWQTPRGTSSNARPTEQNPMVARVAFWTDDESSKINVNVASEGAFWDLPRADTPAERDYGRYQPARNEVYRYPGHPSGVSLSTILYPGSGTRQVFARPYLTDDQYSKVLELSPKVEWYEGKGSGSGTRQAVADQGQGAATVNFQPGDKRLYATVDEMLYDSEAGSGGGKNQERRLNRIFENEETRRFFEYGRHSMTVNSNAPELNLFGTPRVCLWPMREVGPVTGTQRIDSRQTYYDRLISFASTLGTRRYYWQRQSPGSRHNEHYNNARGENSLLLDQYLYQLGDTPIPGYGGTIFRKYGKGRWDDGPSIMVQIWDKMRYTNMNDPLLADSQHYNRPNDVIQSRRAGPNKGIQGYRYVGRGQIAGSCRCGGTSDHNQVWWQVNKPYPRGHGRTYTLSEAAMVFYVRAMRDGQGGGGFGETVAASAISAGEKLVEVGLLLETFCVNYGFASVQPNQRISVSGVSTDGSVSAENMPIYKISSESAPETLMNFPPMKGTGGGIPGVMARWDNTENYVGKRSWGGHGGVRLFSNDLENARSGGDNLFTNPGLGEDKNDVLCWKTVVTAPSGGQSEATIDRANAIILKETDDYMNFFGDPSKPLAITIYDDGVRERERIYSLIQVFHVAFDHPDPEKQGNPIRLPVPTAKMGQDQRLFTWASRVRNSGDSPDILIKEDIDVTRSMVLAHGDARIVSAKRVGRQHMWQPHPNFLDFTKRHAHSLTAADGKKLPGFSAERGYALDVQGSPLAYPPNFAPDMVGVPPLAGQEQTGDEFNFFPRETPEAEEYKMSVDPGITGDWDNGLGAHIDGAYINRPDDGVQLEGAKVAYFDDTGEIHEANRTYFAPNRIINGSGQLGSIPTGVQSEIPWRTLLFRPDVQHYGSRNIPRIGDPPDHVMMDFFWMPIVEPFPISQPFATMGKVNMNYRIAPFDYINRATALHAVMKDQRMLAIENDAISSYKRQGGANFRYPIDIETTLLQFEDRFNEGEIFRSATEICEIYMVPRKSGAPKSRNGLGSPVPVENPYKKYAGLDYPTMRTFWKNHSLTGDNSKERIYANLYPRLTTKSNVYKVHMIVESIRKVRSTAVDVFDPERDKVTGRWRGSATIERNIDPGMIRPRPGRDTVPDYFQDRALVSLPSMDGYYSYRVLNVKEFNP